MKRSRHREASSVPTTGSGRLPQPESSRGEGMVWGALVLATTVAVVQFFAGLAGFAERTPRWSDRVQGLRPAFVRHLLRAPAVPVLAPDASGGRTTATEAVPAVESPAG